MEAGSLADWFSGAASALAVLAAVAGYFIAENQRKADQRSRDETAARLLSTKIVRLTSLTADIHRHLNAPEDGPQTKGYGAGQKWRRIRGLNGLREEAGLALDSAQEDLLMRLQENQFLLDLLIANTRYRALTATMQDYTRRRDALQELHPAPVSMDGVHAVLHLDQADLARLAPYAAALENMLEALMASADEYREFNKGLVSSYNAFIQKNFAESGLPKLVEVDPY